MSRIVSLNKALCRTGLLVIVIFSIVIGANGQKNAISNRTDLLTYPLPAF